MQKNILEELKSKVILSSKNISYFEDFISNKYAYSSDNEKTYIYANAIIGESFIHEKAIDFEMRPINVYLK